MAVVDRADSVGICWSMHAHRLTLPARLCISIRCSRPTVRPSVWRVMARLGLMIRDVTRAAASLQYFAPPRMSSLPLLLLSVCLFLLFACARCRQNVFSLAFQLEDVDLSVRTFATARQKRAATGENLTETPEN